MRDELANAPEESRDRAISGSAKPRLDHLLPRGRGPVRLPLSKWEDQDESHLTGRELLFWLRTAVMSNQRRTHCLAGLKPGRLPSEAVPAEDHNISASP